MRTWPTYSVLAHARAMTKSPELDILTVRKLAVPLASDIRQWIAGEAPHRPLCIDFEGIRAVTTSVAEELGPMLMQTVQQDSALEQRYPLFRLHSPEPTYTFARAFANASAPVTGLALVPQTDELEGMAPVLAALDGHRVVVLGQLSNQMQEILMLAQENASQGRPLASEGLSRLSFLAQVGPAARSKRLTELYARRLLAFRENPSNSKERHFTPVWML